MSSSSSASSSVVHLAYPGEYLPDERASTAASAAAHVRAYTAADDAYTDKAGGRPMWLAELPPPAAPLACGRCSAPLFLLTQLYLPASHSAHPRSSASLQRHLYVFACNKAECSASGDPTCVQALRLAVNEDAEGPAPNPALHTAASASPAVSASVAHAAAATTSSAAAALSSATHSSTHNTPISAAAPAPSSIAATQPPTSTATAPASSIAAATPSAAADEWGSGGWSSDEDSSKGAKKSGAKAAKNPTTVDDADAALSALLAQQSLQQQASKAQKAAQAEKAAKADAKAAAKAAAKEEQRVQAQQELLEKALEQRRLAEESGAAAGASAAVASPAPMPAAAPATCFRPFYLAWTPEPAASSADRSREWALLREFEARVAAEGDDEERGDIGALRGAGVLGAGESAARDVSINSSAAASTGGDDSDDDADAVDRRSDEVQAFVDRLARHSEQCVRYFEPGSGASRKGAVYSTKRELEIRDALAKAATSSAAAGGSATSSLPPAIASVVSSLRCPSCHAPRELEVQLTPKLLWELHVESIDLRDPGQDWSTIDVYTCPHACRTNEYVQEMTHVQPPL